VLGNGEFAQNGHREEIEKRPGEAERERERERKREGGGKKEGKNE
jgi:hypothetical protein